MDKWYDVRQEMKSSGHNLTSVLMNPRETMYDEIYDEFAYEQNETHAFESEILATCISTPEEMQQLSDIIEKLKNIFKTYYEIHRENNAMSIFSQDKMKKNLERKVAMKLQLKRGISDEDVLHCFREVPDFFFRNDFTLRNPDIFEEAMEVSPRGHERLSRYLDLVEVALLRQIWTRSPDFFRALEDIRTLETQVIKAVIHVKDLRNGLQNADEALAMGAIQIPKLYRRQRNEERLHEKILSMQRFIEDMSIIATFVKNSDYMGALQIILSAKKLYEEELVRIECMVPLVTRLESMSTHVVEHLSEVFVSLAVRESPDELLDSGSALLEAATASSGHDHSSGQPALPVANEGDSEDIQDLKSILLALWSAQQLPLALRKYSARLEDSLQLVVRTCISEYSSPLLDEDDLFLAERNSDKATNKMVKLMTPETFMSFLCMCFEQLLHSIRRVVKIKAVIEASLSGVVKNSNGISHTDAEVSTGSSNHLKSSEADAALVEKLKAQTAAILHNCCDLTLKVVAHVTSLRSDANSKLMINEMRLLLETSMNFASSIEAVTTSGTTTAVSTSPPSNALRQCLLTQTKGYINYFHESSKSNLVCVMDSERWDQCDVSEEKQKLIDKLVSGRSFLASKSNTSSSGSSMNKPNKKEKEDVGNSKGSASSNGKKELSPVHVEHATFKVVYSAVYLVDLLLAYLEISVSFPSITTDAISKTGELLTLFDTRTKQLVLGAQAIQTAARLKSISAKHLCLTAQSLGLVVAVLPHIRAALLAQLPPKHHILLTGIDRISAGILEHHNLVLAKFVDIVCDFVDASASRLALIDWDGWKENVVPYFEEILKNLTALHRVLESILPAEQVQDVFSRIFAALHRKMLHHFESIRPNSQAGKQRIVDETSHLVTALSKLKKIDTSTFAIEEAFQDKYLR